MVPRKDITCFGPANALAPKFRLRTTLIVSFVLQVLAIVGLVGYLYLRNEQKAIEEIATQSGQKIAVGVEQNLRSYLAIPHLVNQNNTVAINLGQLNLQNLPGLEQYFWRQLQVFDTLTFVGIGFENRNILGAGLNDDGSFTLGVATQANGYDFRTYAIDQTGDRLQLLHYQSNFDPRTRPWYKAAVAAGKPTWSEIYPNTTGLSAYLSASMPFYNQQGDLQGVLLTNINLSKIGNFLQGLEIGKTGQVFIVERSGSLVATSTGESPFHSGSKDSGAERVKAIESDNLLTQSTMQYLTKNFSEKNRINIQISKLLKFEVKGQQKFLQVSPFQDQFGLDWLIIVVIPESDFTGQIAANTQNAIQLTLVALVVAIALGVLMAQWISRPILRVSQAAEAIARGNLDQHIESSRITELATLANSFNNMAGQLQASFSALRQNESQNRAIVEALPDLLFRAKADGTYIDNPIGQNRLKALFGGNRSLKGVNIADSLPSQQAQQRMQAIRQALQMGQLQVYEQQLSLNDQTIAEEVRIVKVADDEVLIMVRDVTERKQLEVALQESEARFRGVVEQASVGIALVTLTGQFSLVNRRLCQLFGHSEAELCQLTHLDVTHPDDRAATTAAIRRLLAREVSTFSLDQRYIRKDGQIQWCNLTTSSIYNSQGELQYLLGIWVDISERKRQNEILEAMVEERTTELAKANAALRASEAELRGLFAAMDDVITVYNRQGTCLKVASTNPSLLIMSSEEMVGRSIYDIVPKDKADLRLQLIQQVLETRQTTSFEYSLKIAGNASSDEQEVWFAANLSLLSDDTVIMVARDITERKQVEEALQASEAELRALFAAMTDVVIVKDIYGRYCKIAPTNPSNLLSSASDLLSLTEHDIFPKAQADRFVDHIQQVLSTQQMMSIDYCLTIENREVWFTANVSPLAADKVVWVARDISERKRIEDARKQAEIAQQAQLHLLQVILDSMPFPIFYKDSRGIYLGCNQAFLDYRGMTSEQIVGKSVYETAPAHLAETYAAADQALLDSGGTQTYETLVAYADGSQHDVIFYKAVFLNQQGDISGLVGAILDISERKRAEAELQAQQAFLRQILDAVPSSIFVKDREGRFLVVNRSAAGIYGATVEEMLGKTDLDFNRDREEVEHYLADNQEVMTTQQTKIISNQAILNRQGELHWYQTSISPFIDANGEVKGIIGALTDITDRKQAEEALRQSEERNRAILLAIPDLMTFVSAEGIYLDSIRSNSLVDLVPMDTNPVGKHFNELLPPEIATRQIEAIQRALSTGEVQMYEQQLEFEGRQQYEELRVVPWGTDAALIMIRNITDRKQAEEALRLSELKYRSIFENSQVGIGRSRPEDGLILDANQRLVEILGFNSAADLIGQRYTTEFYWNFDDRQRILAELEQQGEVRDLELPVRRQDNSMLWGMFSLKQNLEESCFEFVITDISDRKQAEAALQNSLTQLALANQEIQLLNQRLESENLRLSAELSVVRQLQQMILPKEQELREIAGLEIAGFMEPADEVGGDYYDVIQHDDRVKIGIGDVTGHGLESGVLMIMVQTAVRTLLTNNETDPRRFLNTVNRVIYDNTQRMNSKKNLSLVLLDYQAGQVRLSGQHEEILVVRSNGQVERIDTTDLGFFLGLVPDITEFIAQSEVQLQSGDSLILYTDGIVEAENEAKEYYGLERLCQVVSENCRQSAIEIRQAIVGDVQAHIGKQKVYDDITLLVLKQK